MYSSNNEQINIKQQLIDFFHLFFIDADNPDKDIIIRFYLSLFQLYIEYYQSFESPLIEKWENEIKPYLSEKYPIRSTNTCLFTINSDIHYVAKLIDELKEKYEIKKEEEKPEQKNNFPPVTQNPITISPKEKNSKNKKVTFDLGHSHQYHSGKKSTILDEEVIKKLRTKIKSQISAFLDEFNETKNIKRANSMLSLHRSKTISSLTTCDDSVCFDDIREGKHKINLNRLKVDNNDIYQTLKNSSKDLIQRSKNISAVNFNLNNEIIEGKNHQNKYQMKKNKTSIKTLAKAITSQFNGVEKELESVNIEFSDKNKNIISSISIDLLLKKIIFENFLEKMIF